MTEKQFKQALNTAGFSFIVKYIKEIKENLPHFNEITNKHDYINRLTIEDEIGDRSRYITMNRLNAVLRIVRAEKTKNALLWITQSAVTTFKIKNSAHALLEELL